MERRTAEIDAMGNVYRCRECGREFRLDEVAGTSPRNMLCEPCGGCMTCGMNPCECLPDDAGDPE